MKETKKKIEELERIKQEWTDLDLTDKLVEFTDKINELVKYQNYLFYREQDPLSLYKQELREKLKGMRLDLPVDIDPENDPVGTSKALQGKGFNAALDELEKIL